MLNNSVESVQSVQSVTKSRLAASISATPIIAIATVTAIVNSLIMKQQNLEGASYVHPFYEVAQVFFSQSLLLLVYFILLRSAKSYGGESLDKSGDENKVKLSVLISFIPAIIDFFGMSLTFYSIYAVLPAILLMLKGVTPIVNAIYAAVFLEKKLEGYQKIGILLVCIGGVVACLEQVALGQIENTIDRALGLVFACVSIIVSGFLYVVEQKLAKKYYFHQFQLTGYEGVWGFLFAIIAFIIASYVPCSLHSPFCSGGYMENIQNIGYYMEYRAWLLVLVIVAVINPIVLNLVSIPMKTSVPSVVGPCIDIFVVIFAWLYTLLYLKEPFLATHLIGFLVFGIGTVVYHGMITLPGFKKEETKQRMLEGSTFESGSMAIY